MNSAQITAYQPGIYVKNVSQFRQLHSKPCVLSMSTNPCSSISLGKRGKPSFGLKCRPISKSREPLHICLAGGNGMETNDENSPLKSLEKAMEKFKGPSIEDVLRQQINKGEYLEGGGSGAKPPGGDGGSGGGGDGPADPGGEEEETPAEIFDEYLQMIFGTLGFIFLYIYILTGEELTKLARDFIKYKFGGNPSVRLKNAMYEWGEFYRSMVEEEEIEEDWLETAILNTPTWWHNPDTAYSDEPNEDGDEDEDEDEDADPFSNEDDDDSYFY
ncbi:hypothetical protein TanjilG_14023 [Lupinus angustifolius]|uniref:Uncharacterized protein n=1 Tax=Lupinus angustifolius TaxID=3871 RepID=A0A1J7GNA0_LUPAN|nr:PREDICTED: uncharacterized protein LOC109360974 [Lupinus angustifolius]OIW01992.1 hypothetical protein TanjilG_14023 [Lupinus angustifolius]